MLDRFRREARAVAAVNHPAIVTIYSVEEADGLHFLTMELVEGRSLDHLIPASGLDAERIFAIADALGPHCLQWHTTTGGLDARNRLVSPECRLQR